MSDSLNNKQNTGNSLNNKQNTCSSSNNEQNTGNSLNNGQNTGNSLNNGQNTGNSLSNDKIQETLSRLIGTGLTPKQAIQSYQELDTHQNKIDHEKKGLDFSIFLVRNLLFFLVGVCACKVLLDINNKSLDLNEYFSLLIPIITTALGYILGKKNL